jgi:hypothetical protein
VNLEIAVENEGARRLLTVLLERFLVSGDRGRPVRLDSRRMPEFGLEGRPGEADATWESIKSLESAGIIRIDPIRTTPGRAAYEMQPLVRLVLSEAARAADLIGFALEADPWVKEWMTACEAADWLPAEHRATLSYRPHRIGTRSASEVLDGWRRLLTGTTKSSYIREVAADSFWGLSKAVDDRLQLINQLRVGMGLDPILEMPILLNVHLVPDGLIAGILFIENQSTFELARRGRILNALGMHLVYSAGFKASAARLRDSQTASLFLSDSSSTPEMNRFREWLFSGDRRIPTYFWGDLDYSALSILRSLRTVFPEMRAWVPGYAPLLQRLLNGQGHLPVEDPRKGEQRVIDTTGCSYSDQELLPALDASGRFVDQEAFSPDL